MLKHQHPEFPSDIFLTLLGAGASLTLGTAADASTSEVMLEQFLSTNMAGRIILSVMLPQLSLNTQVTPHSKAANIFLTLLSLYLLVSYINVLKSKYEKIKVTS